MDDRAGGSSDEAAEGKAAFQLRMRARGVRDVNVLRVLERVSRAAFVAPDLGDLASRDLALPIGCGQTMVEPGVLARMLEALAVERSHSVLEIGAGSGYATALLAQLAGSGFGLERFRGLAATAQDRLASLGIGNAAIVWADGLAPTMDGRQFDRVIVHGILAQGPDYLVKWLKDPGRIVYARWRDGDQEVVRSEAGLSEPRSICTCRLLPLKGGLAGVL